MEHPSLGCNKQQATSNKARCALTPDTWNLTSNTSPIMHQSSLMRIPPAPSSSSAVVRSGLLQRKSGRAATTQSSAEAPPIVHDVLRSPGAPLEPAVRSVFENRFGPTLADVRVHTGDQARASARAVGAAAYTVGSHIVVAQPECAVPGSRLLAHELTHVIQQQGRKPDGPIPIGAPDHPAEHEAERSAQAPTAQRFSPAVAVSPMLQRDLFPFFVAPQSRRVNSGTAHPEPGISVTWTGDNIVLQANLQVYGPAASPTVADEMKKTIEKYWNVTSSGNGHSYRISCTVNITHRAENAGADGNAVQVMVVRQGPTAASAVSRQFFIGARMMVFNLDRGTDWTPAHEFGHLLGLDNHYHSTATGSDIDPGWEGNIMADRASGSAVDFHNAEELLNLYAYKNNILPPRADETMA